MPAELLLELDLATINGGVIPGLVAKVKDFVSSDDTVAAFGRFEGTIVPSAIPVDTPVVDTPVAPSSSTTAGSFARFTHPFGRSRQRVGGRLGCPPEQPTYACVLFFRSRPKNAAPAINAAPLDSSVSDPGSGTAFTPGRFPENGA